MSPVHITITYLFHWLCGIAFIHLLAVCLYMWNVFLVDSTACLCQSLLIGIFSLFLCSVFVGIIGFGLPFYCFLYYLSHLNFVPLFFIFLNSLRLITYIYVGIHSVYSLDFLTVPVSSALSECYHDYNVYPNFITFLGS